jgi:hypothetical protein
MNPRLLLLSYLGLAVAVPVSQSTDVLPCGPLTLLCIEGDTAICDPVTRHWTCEPSKEHLLSNRYIASSVL